MTFSESRSYERHVKKEYIQQKEKGNIYTWAYLHLSIYLSVNFDVIDDEVYRQLFPNKLNVFKYLVVSQVMVYQLE